MTLGHKLKSTLGGEFQALNGTENDYGSKMKNDSSSRALSLKWKRNDFRS